MMSGLNGMKEELELVQLMQNQVHYLEISIHRDLLLVQIEGEVMTSCMVMLFNLELKI